ncbi:hypothetical protein DSM19430T_18680 [Desulfovibrio psychrotolerans]|uniref:Uncharacterized protein n=1 Tax=Desulfovibrio psychrotolerans TaxID=415242 RepID=A0A7J0BW26_9BACT|nr:hypothetical protein DSM19430T_18680 [Desulfovibrio psychrotolerans]
MLSDAVGRGQTWTGVARRGQTHLRSVLQRTGGWSVRREGSKGGTIPAALPMKNGTPMWESRLKIDFWMFG